MSTLQGKCIVVTRSLSDAKPFADLLVSHGAEPIIAPMIDIQSPDDTSESDDCLHQLNTYDWVIFTSANAVRAAWDRLAAMNISPQMQRVAAIGVKTGAALQQRRITPHLIPHDHIAEALFDALAAADHLRGQRILLLQADCARPTLANLLDEAGAQVDAITAYHTIHLDADLLKQTFDVITFTGEGIVRNL